MTTYGPISSSNSSYNSGSLKIYRVASTPELTSKSIQKSARRPPSPKYRLYNPQEAIEDTIIDIANQFKATRKIENPFERAKKNNELAHQLEGFVFILSRKKQMEWLLVAEQSLSFSHISQRVSRISKQTLNQQQSPIDTIGQRMGFIRRHSLTPPPKNSVKLNTIEKRRHRPETPTVLQKEQTQTQLQASSSIASKKFDFAQIPSPLNTKPASQNIELQETNEKFMQLTTSVPSHKFGEPPFPASSIQSEKTLTKQEAEETQKVSQDRALVQTLKKTRTKKPAISDQMDIEKPVLAQSSDLQTLTSIQLDQEPMSTKGTSSPTDSHCLPSLSGANSSAIRGWVEYNQTFSLTRGSFFMQNGMFRD